MPTLDVADYMEIGSRNDTAFGDLGKNFKLSEIMKLLKIKLVIKSKCSEIL